MKNITIHTLTLAGTFIFLFTLLLAVSFMSSSSAGIQSQSYKIPAYVLNGGGLQILSENFRQVVSIGESTPTGPSQSDNFINNPGFIPQITMLSPYICDADVDSDCDLDVKDLIIINRYLQGFPKIVPSSWRDSDPNIPSDEEISLKIDECKIDYDIYTIGGFAVPDLVIIYRCILGFSTIVPTLWREKNPNIPPDPNIAKAVEALKPKCPPAKVRKRGLIRYNGYEDTDLLGIEDILAYGGEEDIRSLYDLTGQSLSISLGNGIITIEPSYCYLDADNDTYGDANQRIQAITCLQGYVKDHTDCNDIDPNI